MRMVYSLADRSTISYNMEHEDTEDFCENIHIIVSDIPISLSVFLRKSSGGFNVAGIRYCGLEKMHVCFSP